MLNRLVKVFTLTALICLLATPLAQQRASAQDEQTEPGVFRSPTLEMVARAGFGQAELRYGYGGTWTPFRIMLTNQGEAVTGRLVVATKNSNGIGREFIKDIQLPSGSRQMHEISVFLDSSEDPEVRLDSQGDTVASTTIKVESRGGYYGRVVVAVVDNDSTTLNNLANLEMPLQSPRKPFNKITAENTPQTAQDANADPSQTNQNSNTSQQNRRRRNPWGYSQDPSAHPVVVSPDDLPRDFIAYNPVDVVVLGDAPLSQLTEDQARALRYWVANGGMLIVTGGADVAGLRAAKLDAILPVEAQGSVTVPGLAELTDVYGQFENKDALLILAAKSKPNAVTILGSEERAIVAESKYGNGVVRFVAYNPRLNPYRAWGAAKHLWTDLLRPAAETKSNAYMWGRQRNGSGGGIQDTLINMAGIKPTSSTYFILFLLAYVLAVGPVNYFILRWKKKLDLAWITIPAAVLLFTVISVVVAQFNRSGAVAADASLVELYQSEGIHLTRGEFMLRSNSTGRRNMVLESREAYAMDDNYNGPPSSSEPLYVERQPGRFKLQVPTTNGRANFLQTRAVGENNSPLVAVQLAGATAVRVKNLSDATISNAVYVSSSGVSDTFTLAPNEERQVALNVPQGTRFAEWYASQLTADSDESAAFDGLSNWLGRGTARSSPALQGFWGDDFLNNTYKAIERPMVLGFIDKPAERVDIEGMANRHSKTFYVVHL